MGTMNISIPNELLASVDAIVSEGRYSSRSEFTEVIDNHQVSFSTKMRRVIFPSALPYVITGLSSTVNSAWTGITIGEFCPNITPNGPELVAKDGMMYYISANIAAGNIGPAAYISLLFAAVVAIYGIVFTRNLMDLARKKYIVEEGIFAARCRPSGCSATIGETASRLG